MNREAERDESYLQLGALFGRIVITVVVECDTKEEAISICKTIQYYMVTGDLKYLQIEKLNDVTPKTLF